MGLSVAKWLLLLGFGFLLAGAALVNLYRKDWRKGGWIAAASTLGAAAAFWVLAVRVFVNGEIDVPAVIKLGSLGSSLTFHVDRLSALFLAMASLVGLVAAVYAVDYMRHLESGASAARFYSFYLLLMAAIAGVVTVSDLLFFLIFWEMMTLTSWVLVWFEREDEEKVRAAWQYFVITHAASACMLVAAVAIYAKSGSFAFADVSVAMGLIAQTSPVVIEVLVGLLLIAFVTKAGMFPFGGWLPAAHPAAPSPASAVFAGGMIKAGIYAIIRLFWGLLPVPGVAHVWGGILAVLGTVSIFVGTITALRQDDSKRVLSFHTIGQIGYIILALGTGVFFLKSNPTLATIALIAGLYHTVNHACFKSLLFLNAGAVQYNTKTRNLNLVGGLGKLMPLTMATAIIAALSISGIPPFCGFTSKWLIYHCTAHGGISVPIFLLLCVVAIFSSIVTLASFMKVLSCTFLGQLATNRQKVTGDVPAPMQASQLALSAACVVLGVAPLVALKLFYGVAAQVMGYTHVPAFTSIFGLGRIGIALDFGTGTVGVWNPARIILAMAACTLVSYAIYRAALATSRATANWYGGEEQESEDVRYRAHGFCLPFKEHFAKVYPSFPIPRIRQGRVLQKIYDFDRWLYTPLVNVCGRVTGWLAALTAAYLKSIWCGSWLALPSFLPCFLSG